MFYVIIKKKEEERDILFFGLSLLVCININIIFLGVCNI